MVDPGDLKINYMNAFSRETLKKLEHLLPVKVEQMLGQCIDIFHKVPSHQRRILSDPRNLPHRSNINVGPEVLALEVNAIKDKAGNYIGPMLTWSVVTEKVRQTPTARLRRWSTTCRSTDDDRSQDSSSPRQQDSIRTLRKPHLADPRRQAVGSCIDLPQEPCISAASSAIRRTCRSGRRSSSARRRSGSTCRPFTTRQAAMPVRWWPGSS
jgi:methyl-accepting chemotaxis protein